ncbi:beta-galactosidase [Kribbella flavida DSM 17836]|uniref:Beta-glucosidase n=1 Tax=Kribbella flavida (strain DSM 17836 / JCM 10339 / NBRC 14399) TaxID=479435 RepID=D2PR30_KRIFD|nr:GH1 family beta-glucosidase [Kribbella flavida]ADB32978.1 beta-galactosidase [Kribbella flavida DSM 17836]
MAERGSIGRRAVLVAAASGAAAVLAGCRGDGEPEAAPTTPATRRVELPAGLALGVATSAYQIEGAVGADGRGRSIWDEFCAVPGKIDDSSSGAVAADHYRRWEADLDLLTELGVASYRFSIAWPRIFPQGTGTVNPKGLDFYRRLVGRLRERGISPVATMYHWDLPQALQQRGGWENRDVAGWFGDYAETLVKALDGVDSWLTVNEPKIIVQQGYQRGWMAPGRRDEVAAGKVLHHLNLAHGRAVQAFRASGSKQARIGPCLAITPCYPFDESPESRQATRLADVTENTLYLEPLLKGSYPALTGALDPRAAGALRAAVRDGDLAVISEPVDFLGVNYYSPAVVDPTGEMLKRYPVSAAGWQQIHPGGLTDLLVRLHRDYGLEIVVAENGLPDTAGESPDADETRIGFLRDHLAATQAAMSQGVKVRAYHAWTLLDDFEWARGYTQRWGLVHVDFPSQRRTPKKSARWYADVIRTRSLELG